MATHKNRPSAIDQPPESNIAHPTGIEFLPLRAAQDALQLCQRLADIIARRAIDESERGSAAWASATSMMLNQLAQSRGLFPAMSPSAAWQAEWLSAFTHL